MRPDHRTSVRVAPSYPAIRMSALAAGLYATAVVAVVLSGAGLVVVPHREPPGTPVVHEHAVTALRFPILLLAETPGVPADNAAVAAKHAGHRAVASDAPTLQQAHALALLAGAAILALIAAALPRLPRPTRRPLAELVRPEVSAAQWSVSATTPPPRCPIFAA